jgi:hypothetical protein
VVTQLSTVSDVDSVADAIRRVAAGESVDDPAGVRAVVNRLRTGDRSVPHGRVHADDGYVRTVDTHLRGGGTGQG